MYIVFVKEVTYRVNKQLLLYEKSFLIKAFLGLLAALTAVAVTVPVSKTVEIFAN